MPQDLRSKIIQDRSGNLRARILEDRAAAEESPDYARAMVVNPVSGAMETGGTMIQFSGDIAGGRVRPGPGQLMQPGIASTFIRSRPEKKEPPVDYLGKLNELPGLVKKGWANPLRDRPESRGTRLVASNALRDWGKSIRDAAPEPEEAGLVGDVATAFGATAAMWGLGWVGGPAGIASSSFLAEGGSEYYKWLDKNEGDLDGAWDAMGRATLPALMEALPAAKVLKRINTDSGGLLWRAMRKGAVVALPEGAQEASQEVATILNDYASGEEIGAINAMMRMGYSALIGIATGGLLGSIAGGAEIALAKPSQEAPGATPMKPVGEDPGFGPEKGSKGPVSPLESSQAPDRLPTFDPVSNVDPGAQEGPLEGRTAPEMEVPGGVREDLVQAQLAGLEAAPEDVVEGDVQAMDEAQEDPGAASVEEVKDSELPTTVEDTLGASTSIRNRAIDRDLEELGLPPATHGEKLTFEGENEAAAKTLEANPRAGAELLESLSKNDRAMTGKEVALLTRDRVNLRRRHKELSDAQLEALEGGDTQRAADLLEEVKAVQEEFILSSDIITRARTRTAQGLVFARMELKEDFSLVNLERQKRIVNLGKQLSSEQQSEIRELNTKLEHAERRLEESLRELETRQTAKKGKKRSGTRSPSKVLAFTGAQADKARSRIKARGTRLYAGIDPAELADEIIVGVDIMARGAVSLKQWTETMAKEFGDTIKPHLDSLYKIALKQYRGVVVDRSRTGGKLGTRNAVRQVAESLIAEGVVEREALTSAVSDAVGDTLTVREIRDLISGYGLYTSPTNDAIKKRLQELGSEMQDVSKLEDMEAGLAPKKTGRGRQDPTDEKRRLTRLVNEKKKELGITGTDPEASLKTALETIKTRLRNQISDVERQLETGKEDVKTKGVTPSDEETVELRTQLASLREQYGEMFDKPRQEPGHKEVLSLRAAERAVEKSLTDYKRRVEAGETAAKKAKPGIVSPKLAALRARRDALMEELKLLRDAQNPKKSKDEIALQSLKTRLRNEAASLNEQIARGDFTKKVRRQVVLDDEAISLKADVEKLKREWMQGLAKDRWKNLSRWGKARALSREFLIDLQRAFIAGFEFSAVLRQGMAFIFHPDVTVKALGGMFKGTISEERAAKIDIGLRSREMAAQGEVGGLELTNLGEDPNQWEEAIRSKFSDKIPFLRMSNRAYITFLNIQRAEMFDRLVRALPKEASRADLQDLANLVNVGTGRGNPGRARKYMHTASALFWAPRLTISRFQLLIGALTGFRYGVGSKNKAVRKLIAREYARYAIGMSVIWMLAYLLGFDIEKDPRSSKFGKIQISDNTLIDPLAGLSQVTVFSSRMVLGSSKTGKGEIVPLREYLSLGADGSPAYGGDDVTDVTKRFLRSKLSPAWGTGINLIRGENVVGEKVTPLTFARDAVVPLAYRDIYDAMVFEGIDAGTALAIIPIFGMGLQSYEQR